MVGFYCLFYYFYISGNIETSRVVGWKRWKNISKTNDPNNKLVAVETNFVEKTMQVSSNIIDNSLMLDNYTVSDPDIMRRGIGYFSLINGSKAIFITPCCAALHDERSIIDTLTVPHEEKKVGQGRTCAS